MDRRGTGGLPVPFERGSGQRKGELTGDLLPPPPRRLGGVHRCIPRNRRFPASVPTADANRLRQREDLGLRA